MKENFITAITVNNSRNVKNLEIPLSSEQRQHLIITGKNGSGKTSLLLELNKFLLKIDTSDFILYKENVEKLSYYISQLGQISLQEQKNTNLQGNINGYQKWLKPFGGTGILFSNVARSLFNKNQDGKFLLAFFDAKRASTLSIPKGIEKVKLKKKYGLTEKANQNFIQYIVNLKADRSFARDDNESETVTQIDLWFKQFENRLKAIFDDDKLVLQFDRKAYNFNLIPSVGDPFNFHNLSDGYSAIISIVSELLLRMEAHNAKNYDLEGIVLIDEIETHLHIELQKRVLPFLTDFFPKLQFIVTTHSPFVLSSISNSTICDLETKTVISDLSSYSYDALIESYFKSDKYSDKVKNKIKTFESLIKKANKSMDEKERLKDLRNYFAHAPIYLSKELRAKLQQIELDELNTK